jgi:preprotein translocase subunit SecB
MAETTDQPQTEQGAKPNAAHTLPITILRQYIRDLSFENPAAPESLRLKDTPDMEIDIDVQARKIEDKDTPNLFEVVLQIRVVTTTTDMPVFLAELEYATLVTIGQEVPEDQHHPILFIEVPRFAYPFASQVITNTCQQGGFPPLFLKPIDFHSLYMDRHKSEIEEAQRNAEAEKVAS